MIVKPFRGLRPRKDLAHRIPSYPYDVLSSDEARELAADDPYSFLHVIKAEIDLDAGADPYHDDTYRRGRDNLRAMIDSGWLVRDERPAYYVYRLVMSGREQVGVLGAAAVEDYLEDRIKKHEFTLPQKENDRIRLNTALGANPGPVFLTYRGIPELTATVGGITSREPVARFEASDGIEHALWVVDDPSECERIEGLFGKIPCSYVADGHHRAAAAAKVGTRDHVERDHASRYFLAAHFPADQLRVLDYNRVVADLNGLDTAGLLGRLEAAAFRITADHRARRPPQRETFSMYLDGRWYRLDVPPGAAPTDDVARRLDISILTDLILKPILGIGDLRTDKRIDFVGGIRGMDELERLVDSGRAAVAFALFPTSIDDVMQVADAGKVMPAKSTWFEPKLRSGMVVQLLD